MGLALWLDQGHWQRVNHGQTYNVSREWARSTMIGSEQRRKLANEPYADRNETLRLLGFPTYSAYSRSVLWKIVRQRALDVYGHICKACGAKATQVHHASYVREVLIGEDVRGLVPLCSRCHRIGSVTKQRSRERRQDHIEVRHLHETNLEIQRRHRKLWPLGGQKREPRKDCFCACGNQRKENRQKCLGCLRAAGVIPPKPKRLTIEQIRERSLEYAGLK